MVIKQFKTSTMPARGKAIALRQATAAMLEGKPVPAGAAAWLADGFRYFLENEGSSLDDALLLKPRRGGGHETIWKIERYARRDRLLMSLANLMGGPSWGVAGTIAKWVRKYGDELSREGMPSSDALPGMGCAHRELLWLIQQQTPLPKSRAQIWRILSGDTISARR